LTEDDTSALRKHANARALDLDISANLIAERLVGEILGWDLVDWPAIELHKGRKFSFGHQRKKDPSIYGQLRPLFDRCDPIKKDFSALKPSPIVNASLTKLVDSLCHHIGRRGLPVDEAMGSALRRTSEQDQLHLAVVERVLVRIETDCRLEERAKLLKQIAAVAESELEKHFADLINVRLEDSFLPGGNLDSHRINSLRDRARHRVEEKRLLNERELVDLSMPDLVLDDEARTRIEMAKILLSRFPYVRNYELMLLGELTMLQQPLTPRFVPERRLPDGAWTIDEALIERLDHAIAKIASHIGPVWQSKTSLSLQDENRTIAICGSGPLPMSALFLHLLTDMQVTLIDDDQDAVERSRRLIANLEHLGVIRRNSLTVLQRRAGDVVFYGPQMPPMSTSDVEVTCDAVLIASLVDAESKASIANQLRANSSAPELLVMRSATGLSAKLAYDSVPTETFSRGKLVYCGETVPATQVAVHLNRVEAAHRQVVCTSSPDVLAIAHSDVVNTTEIYRRIATDRVGALEFADLENFETLITSLESAAKIPQ
jgi:hypothetical protein